MSTCRNKILKKSCAMSIFLLLIVPFIVSANEKTEKNYINSIGMEFVLIPAGSFMMGSEKDNLAAEDDEKPRHLIKIGKPFYIGRFEVTQKQWEDIIGSSAFELSRSNQFYSLPGMAKRLTGPFNPVTVSWFDAQRFIQQINLREGTEKYRLPTEAEWEYAAKAGTTTDYSFGDDQTILSQFAWFGETFATGSTHPVGLKKPNNWGLYDVHGNVWEWVNDWYDPDYYSKSPEIDPAGPVNGTKRVVRGGSWHESATGWRTSFRRSYEPNYRGISIGFRLVASIE